ncbi:response regulator [Aliiroseovarius sediminis]|uniref:response regulator n=1 Tax=Aliiroseovarius sediminis TaxID=2925839 RepID=UPI001F5734C4|nr:response regulator [Aliiroseovarius sediminis]MCI2393203.1 sigma-54 dependent transcriptional regulator [Aliiroseovarius sediminis]
MDGTVLVADDDRTIRTVLTQALTRAGCRVHATGSMVTLMRWVDEGRGDVVISDVVMPDGNGLEALPQIVQRRPDLPVIVISAQNTIMTAIQAAEGAAFDYLPKPFDLPDLMKRTAKALERKRLRPGARGGDDGVAAEIDDISDLPLIGHSPAMQTLYRLVARVVNTDLPVLITGESGTGKSLIARALHDYSDRRAAPFVVATPDDLTPAGGVEAALRRAGAGTIVFDGVEDSDPDLQARLSRAIDKMDSDAPRLVAISQGDLADAAAQGIFRDDLYYRLAGVVIAVPSLRERLDDIAALSDHFLTHASRDERPPRQFSADAVKALRRFVWPGNLRELENLVNRLAVTSADDEIAAAEVEMALTGAAQSPAHTLNLADERLSDAVGRHLQRYFDLHQGTLPPPGLYQRILREVELPLIQIALDATGGNQARSADLLGINRNTLRKKITELEIEVTRRRKLM